MKLKHIVLAGLVIVAGSASAAVVDPAKTCPTTFTVEKAAQFANYCKPDVTFVIAGSSALGDAVAASVPSFFNGATSYTLVKDGSGPWGSIGTAEVTMYYGMSNPTLTGTSKRLVIYYNNRNGSAAGVSSLMAKTIANVPEAKMLPLTGDSKTTCNAGATAADGVTCTGTPVFLQADYALSDVHPQELLALNSAVTGGVAPSALTVKPLFMQGFGIAVSSSLYSKLQAAQGLTGKDAPCAAGDYTLACQPSISRLAYASLVSNQNASAYKTLESLLGTTDTSVLTLARRDEMSGTQAASQIFFNGSTCGAYKTPAVLRGPDATTGATTTGVVDQSTTSLSIKEASSTGGVETLLKTTTDDVIGILPLSKAKKSNLTTAGVTYRFVKIDGVSPDLNSSVTTSSTTLSSTVRENMINGSWPFQVTSFGVVTTKSLTGTKSLLISNLDLAIRDEARNFAGVGYFSSIDATKLSKVKRAGESNCTGLVFVK